MTSPLLFLGVDIAYARDTAAVVCIYRDHEIDKMVPWGHKIWYPPVHIPNVTACVENLLETQRVGGVFYDPAQWVGEVQRLISRGYEGVLNEINQQTMMVEIGNNLSSHMQRGDFVYYSDPEMRGQYSWCNAEATERGYRIVKRKQTKQIDSVVAEAMALWGCTTDMSMSSSTGYDQEQHEVPLEELVV